MYKLPVITSLLFITASLFYGAAWAQLPPTNMGKFVHQPGDNQYTAQTQLDRHPVSMPNAAPAGQSAMTPIATDYKTTPAAPKADISLLPIVADEPIKPAGFPPLPDRLDLPTNGTGMWAGNNGRSTGGGTIVTDNHYISSAPTGVHEHYVHYQPGAFIPTQDLQHTTYRPSAVDYYNVNPAAKPVYQAAIDGVPGSAPIATPATQALQHVGPEPQLAPDAVSKPEAPSAVTVNQSVSQDLSLPEDDFNKHYPTSIGNTSGNRAAAGLGRVLTYPLYNLGMTAGSMIGGAAGSMGMYTMMRH